MKLTIPELAVVVLIGPSGAGKSTFARKHFKPTEILSSDYFRGLVADDENDQGATKHAFEALHFMLRKRLELGRLTVIDATNVQPEARAPLVAIAREFHCLPVAIAFNLPERLCQERNVGRPDRDFGSHVVRGQHQQMRRSLRALGREGFRHLFVFESPQEVEAATVERQPLWNNLKHEHGPFDIIGDIHGCCDELEALLAQLGYTRENGVLRHPTRKAVFLGDIVDRGPRVLDALATVRTMVQSGAALCVPGNHDIKFMRWLRGKQVRVAHGLEQSIAEVEALPAENREARKKELADWIDDLVSHYVLNDGKLVVAHAGMKESMQGRGSAGVREFALYGETTGETDEFGLPVRYDWAAEYRGRAAVVYGHTPVVEPEWINNTVCVDTGCVFGGKLTALRWPEREFVSVPAVRVYCEPAKPLAPAQAVLSGQQQLDELLDLADVTGKRIVHTPLMGDLTVREENATAALEVMSRFAANPKWLIYLPPTMAPCATSQEPGFLEHPAQAFHYFREEGIERVICEQKHMGSRAVIVLCRNEEAARKRFGVENEGRGVCLTRTGRKFFEYAALEAQLLARVAAAAERANLWDELQTEWLLLDCELMPWSAKAQDLLRRQYAGTGAAASAALTRAGELLSKAGSNGVDVATMVQGQAGHAQAIARYREAYRRYCWPVNSLEDFKLAPFHLLASEGACHATRDHVWHMEKLAKLCGQDPLLRATEYRVVNLAEGASEAAATQWWLDYVRQGGEGMVVKPLEFTARRGHGLVQPAIKCRGLEYLRIIYGPNYDAPQNLERLRERGLGHKRSLALREFALGIEGIERFVRKEPLRRVHECAFAVLALESEPVDPRL